MRLLSIVATILIPSIAIASYCGTSGVPYSFEVLDSGAPVLGCAQPSCVIAPNDFVEDSQFLTDINGVADGFFRAGDRSLKRYRHDNAPILTANCSGGFSQLSCPRKNQWVGGIEYIDHPRQPLILQCCTFEGLRFSQEVGVTVVGPGETITGGEVIRNGRQISFDVIANVRKIVQAGRGRKASYEVTVRRMNCLPDPPEIDNLFDKEVSTEILRVFTNAKSKDIGTKEKFEKKSTPEAKVNKNPIKKTNSPTPPPTQFGVRQYAGETENSISVDPLPVNTNIEPLPATPGNQQSLPIAPAPAAPTTGPIQPGSIETATVAPVASAALPGFQSGAFPGFPAPNPATGFFSSFPTFPPMTFATFAPVTFAPSYQTTTSTWEAAIAKQPPRPTYANGYEVFPTLGTAYVTATPMTFPTFAPLSGVVTPATATADNVPHQQQLPSLATPLTLNAIEHLVSAPGGSANVAVAPNGTVDGGVNANIVQHVDLAAVTSESTRAVANGAPTYTGSVYGPGYQSQNAGVYQQNSQNQLQQPATTGQYYYQQGQGQSYAQNQAQQPAYPGYVPPIVVENPVIPGSPHVSSYAWGSSAVRPLSSLPGTADGAAFPTLPPMPTFPSLPTFSFPTLPPVQATTPHPFFTLPPPQQSAASAAPQQTGTAGVSAPAQVQGTLLFPGIQPIQFPGLGTFSGISTHKEK